MYDQLAAMTLRLVSHIKYRRGLFKVNDYFLCGDAVTDADINYCIQCSENIEGVLQEFHTLLVDLAHGQEQLWKNIYHRTRSEITSFTANQAHEHHIITELSYQQLKEFTKLFNRFAKYKNIRKAETFRLEAYRRQGLLAISFIRQNNHYLCINFYRVTQQRATNLYSFHLKHENGHLHTASHFGRAHRTLHWLDLLRFRQIGVQFYDFCGWYSGTEDQQLLNINRFKEQFGGKKIKEYSGVIYKNRVLKFLKRLG